MDAERAATAQPAVRTRGFDYVPLLIAAVVVVLDQLTKTWVIRAFGPPEERNSKVIVPDLLDFRHDINTGLAFSQLQGQNALIIIIVLVVVALLVYYYRALPQGTPTLRLAMGGVLGGAVGNIIDRFRLGHVTDWIHVTHYPTFNIADSCITLGMITLAVSIFFMDRGSRNAG